MQTGSATSRPTPSPSTVTSSLPVDSVPEAVRAFALEGELRDCSPFRRGHIHDTYVSTWSTPEGPRRFLHQRMNREVFHDIPGLMHNIQAITEHLAHTREEGAAEALQLVPTRGGESWLQHASGAWRTYVFVEGTESFDLCTGADQARAAAAAFAHFQSQLRGFDASLLRETIPHFFSTPHRLRQLREAVEEDAAGRGAGCGDEIAFAMARAAEAGVVEDHLASGAIPRRVVHGDTKLNNVLFDVESGEARCIVDLDTCMPGYSLYDFGDLVRFTAATAGEDETDLERVGMDLELYRALAEGYLEHARGFLTPLEVDLMPVAARLVTYTIGLRFLADHLAGDVYFKTSRPGHNLDRARVQFALVADMERQADEMQVG